MGMSNADGCVHCGKCTKECLFLKKYQLDLAGFELRPDLAYHCFLCGRCKAVCPKGIDGSQIAQVLRAKVVINNGGKIPREDYGWLLWEKNPYKFAKYKTGQKKSVLFPGCNFPSFYPKTMKYLSEKLQEAGIGTAYDCCQKPVDELGLTEDANRNMQDINRTLDKLKIEEVVILCPNCYHYMRGKLSVPIVTIYAKLKELGLGNNLREKSYPFYYPCPDRESMEMMQDVRAFLGIEETDAFSQTQCCGLGGCAGVREPKLAKEMCDSAAHLQAQSLYTYCASCISNFRRNGFAQSYHILPLILGMEEKVPLGIRPFINRALKRFL